MRKLLKLALTVLLSVMLCLGIISCGGKGESGKDLDQILGEYGITLDGGNFSDTAKLIVEEVGLDTQTATEIFDKFIQEGITLDNEAKTYLFDICVEDGGVEVQPDGTVKVTIPAPEGSDEEYVVYHVKDSGDIEEIISYLQDGKLVFETDGFSVFVISVKNKQTGKNLTVKNYVNRQAGFTNFGFNHVFVNGYPIRDSENLKDEFVFNTGDEIVLTVDLPESSGTFLGWYEADYEKADVPTGGDPVLKATPISTEKEFVLTMPESDCEIYAVFMPTSRSMTVDGAGATVEIGGTLIDSMLSIRPGKELTVKVSNIPDKKVFAGVEIVGFYGQTAYVENAEFTYTVGLYDTAMIVVLGDRAPDSISADVEIFGRVDFAVGADIAQLCDTLRVVANYGDEEVVLKKDEYSLDLSKVNANEEGTYEIIIRHNQFNLEFSFNITLVNAYSLEVRVLTLPESETGEVLISEKSYEEWNDAEVKLFEKQMVPFSASENEDNGIFFLGWFEYMPMPEFVGRPVEQLSREELACVFGEEPVTTRRSFTYEMVARDTIIYAVYGKTQSVNVNLHPDSIGMGYFMTGEFEDEKTNTYYNFAFAVSVDLTAIANDGYVFDGWYEIEPQNGEYFKVYNEPTLETVRSSEWSLYLKFVEEPRCEFSAYSEIEQSSESYEWSYNFSQVNGEAYGDDFYSDTLDMGETVTIKANPAEYCEFIGWFEVDEITDNGFLIGDLISETLEYTFTADGETLTVVAVYREIPVVTVVVESGKCGTLIINGVETDRYEGVHEVGEEVTISIRLDGSMSFVKWVTHSGNDEVVLSTETTFTFVVGREYAFISAVGELIE